MDNNKKILTDRQHVNVAFLNRLFDMDLKATKSSNRIVLTKSDGSNFTEKERKNILKFLKNKNEYF